MLKCPQDPKIAPDNSRGPQNLLKASTKPTNHSWDSRTTPNSPQDPKTAPNHAWDPYTTPKHPQNPKTTLNHIQDPRTTSKHPQNCPKLLSGSWNKPKVFPRTQKLT